MNFIKAFRNAGDGKLEVQVIPSLGVTAGKKVKITSSKYNGIFDVYYVYNFTQGGYQAGAGQNIYINTPFIEELSTGQIELVSDNLTTATNAASTSSGSSASAFVDNANLQTPQTNQTNTDNVTEKKSLWLWVVGILLVLMALKH